MVGKKRDNKFLENVTSSLEYINYTKRELKKLRNEEIRKFNIQEKEEINLIKEKIKKQREVVLNRYEEKKKNLGKVLLQRKTQELRSHLYIEKKSLSKTDKEISRIRKNLKKIKKR